MLTVNFIPIDSNHRLIISFISLIISCVVLFYINYDLSLISGLIIVLYFLKLFLYLLPLLFFKSKYFLNPLIFITLWALVTKVYPESSLLVSGLLNYPVFENYDMGTINKVIAFKLYMDCLFILFIYVGFFLIQPKKTLILPNKQLQDVPLKLMFLLVFTFFIIVLMSNQLGSIEQVFMTKGKYIAQKIGGHWNFLAGFLTVGVWLSAAVLKRPLRSFVFIISFISALCIEFLVTASRGSVLAIIIITIIIIVSKQGNFRIKKLFLLFIGLILLVGFLTSLRDIIQLNDKQLNVQSSILGLSSKAINSIIQYSGNGNSDFAIYDKIIENEEYLYGRSYWAILVAPIPRSLLKEKPMGVGRLASQTFMPEYKHKTGVPPSSAGEAYWNFGIIGVIFIATLFGIVLKLLWKFIQKNNHPEIMVLYIITLYYLKPQTSIFYNWLHAIVPAIIVLIFFIMPKVGFLNNKKL